MPKLKPDSTPAYLLPASSPIHSAERLKREAELKANLYAILKLLVFSAIAGALLALRK